jgi:hypothetical protein
MIFSTLDSLHSLPQAAEGSKIFRIEKEKIKKKIVLQNLEKDYSDCNSKICTLSKKEIDWYLQILMSDRLLTETLPL